MVLSCSTQTFRGGPGTTYKIVVHGRREQRKPGPGNRPDERVDGDGAVRVETVAVDDVVHALPEGHETAHTEQGARQDLRHPGDVWIGGPLERHSQHSGLGYCCAWRSNVPTKPKQADREDDGSDDHWW